MIAPHASLWAVSDLHIRYPENRAIVESLRPQHHDDWLIVAGDVGERVADIEWALGLLASRFATVVWAPGNHELWTVPDDPVRLVGEERYHHLVAMCRRLGVVTPEDAYRVWDGPGGPVVVAPLLVLYDYTFRPDGARTKAEALDRAYAAGLVCNDEYMLHYDPYPSREAWSQARVEMSENRLVAVGGERTVLVNHFPLVREPTRALRYPEFAQWCGTELTADWHRQFHAAVVVYGHLHIPRTTWHGGVRCEEVSVGYPYEWGQRPARNGWLRRILPEHDD